VAQHEAGEESKIPLSRYKAAFDPVQAGDVIDL
jgi:hypothetical protein